MPEGREKGWLLEPTAVTTDAAGQEHPEYTAHKVWVKRVGRVAADEGLVDPLFLQTDTVQFTVPRQKSINDVDPSWLYRDYQGKNYRVVGATPSTGRRKVWRIAAERAEGSR